MYCISPIFLGWASLSKFSQHVEMVKGWSVIPWSALKWSELPFIFQQQSSLQKYLVQKRFPLEFANKMVLIFWYRIGSFYLIKPQFVTARASVQPWSVGKWSFMVLCSHKWSWSYILYQLSSARPRWWTPASFSNNLNFLILSFFSCLFVFV